MGGTTVDPTYEQVAAGGTGHAEVCEVTFDPEQVSYEDLLGVFWNCHNPTSWHLQGKGKKDQYRSAIYYHTPDQKAAACRAKNQLEESGKFSKPIVTQILPASTFYRAEERHQQYKRKRAERQLAKT